MPEQWITHKGRKFIIKTNTHGKFIIYERLTKYIGEPWEYTANIPRWSETAHGRPTRGLYFEVLEKANHCAL